MTDFEYLFQVVWTQNSSPGRAIVITLLVITLWALVCVIWHWRRYSGTETAVLEIVRGRLHALTQASTAPVAAPKTTKSADAKVNARETTAHPKLIDIAELSKGLSSHTLVGERLATIARLRGSQVKVNVAALQQITGDRESARASMRFPESAIGLLMLIGLFGTFVGIATTFQAVSADVTPRTSVSANDTTIPRVQLVEQRVQNAFAGMRTKFAASIAGLAGAILLSLMNLQLARAQGRFISELERFTVVELLPATIPSVEDELLLDRVSRQLDEGFTRLDSLAQANVKAVEDIAGIQAGFAKIVENVSRSTRSEGTERLQAVIGQLSSVIEQVVHVNQSVRDLTTSLPAAIQSSSQRIEQAIGADLRSTTTPTWSQPMAAVFGVGLLFALAWVLLATR